MGANASDLSSEEVQELVASTPFSQADIKRLYARFRTLDRAKTGRISASEFTLIPELSMNPLCERIIALFDQDGKDQVNFYQFVHTLAVFHPSTPHSAKQRFIFRCYDVDGDGRVSRGDLFHVMKLLVGSNLDDRQVDQIVAKTFEALDLGRGEAIEYDTFVGTLRNDDAQGLGFRFAAA